MTNKFEQALKSTLNDEVAISENGATMFSTSGKKLLDINFAISSLRNKTDADIEKMFSEAFYENILLAVKWLFMCRDVRGGTGERRTFRICFKWLANTRPELVKKLISLVAEYGRWDDLFCLMGTSLENDVIDVIDAQWTTDIANMNNSKSISLLAKWMPSVNTSSIKTVALARKLIAKLNLSEKIYRKTLSKMRSYLKVIEQKMSAKKWNEIDYEAVPSKANVKYNAAFLRNDETRRRAFLSALEKGEAKINSATNFPCDIVHSYSSSNTWCGGVKTNIDPALEAMWKALPNIAVNGNVLAVCDGSGSMTTQVSGSMTALEVCNALGIYCAEHCTGPFKDKYITFSERPQYVDMSKAKSLHEKLDIAYKHNECANTNIEAVFNLVLKTAIDNQLTQDDIPTLVILSDMEVDNGADFGGEYNRWNNPGKYDARKHALMEQIRQKWANAGYKLPRLIWWNIASRTGVVPMQQNPDTGMILCSGYSQSQFKMIASNKTDPYEVLVEALNVERYQPVEDAIKNLI